MVSRIAANFCGRGECATHLKLSNYSLINFTEQKIKPAAYAASNNCYRNLVWGSLTLLTHDLRCVGWTKVGLYKGYQEPDQGKDAAEIDNLQSK